MQLTNLWRFVSRRIFGRHGNVKSFEHAIHAAGGETGRVDRGLTTIPTRKVVGSVNRWRNLRSDFFYREGKAMTDRFVRIGNAIRQGKDLPPLEVYKMKPRQPEHGAQFGHTEYYVVDGHHRVAMARKLGQDFLDAHVVEYQVRDDATTEGAIDDAFVPGFEPAADLPASDEALPERDVIPGELHSTIEQEPAIR